MFGFGSRQRRHGLEGQQLADNREIAGQSNLSASNDPAQVPHDTNEQLIEGAQSIIAGRTLGLSEEETLSAVSRRNRRQKQRESFAGRADRQRSWAQSQNTLVDEGLPAEIKGVGYADEDIVDPRGQDQSAFQEWGAGNLSAGRSERLQQGLIDRSEMSAAEAEAYADATERSPQGTAGVREALQRLQKGTTQFGYEAFPGSAGVEGSLERGLEPGRYSKEEDRSIAHDLVASESSKRNAEAEQASWFRAQADARKSLLGGGVGDAVFDQMGRRPAEFPYSAIEMGPGQGPTYVDPSTNSPLGEYGPAPVNMSQGATLNAPAPTNTTAWAAVTKPEMFALGKTVGNYPQVDIGGVTQQFSQRVSEALGPDVGVSPNVRSLDEMQRAIDLVKAERRRKGGKFHEVDASGERRETREPSVQAVLNSMRYQPEESKMLANALFQLEAAKRFGVESQGKQQYYTRTGPGGTPRPVEFSRGDVALEKNQKFQSGEAAIARVPRTAKIALTDPQGNRVMTKKGNPAYQQVSEAFKSLKDPLARSEEIGAVAGEGEIPIKRSTMSGEEPVDAVGMRDLRAGRYNAPKEAGGIIRRFTGGSKKTPSDERRLHEAKYLQGTRDLQVKNFVAEERGKRAGVSRKQKEQNIIPGSLAKSASDNAFIDSHRASTGPAQSSKRMSPQARIDMMRERREAERRRDANVARFGG